MATKPATYWQKRFEIYEQRSNLASQTHIKSLVKEYRAAQRAVASDLKVFYNRLAANNDLPNAVAAKKLLDKNELAEFKMSLGVYTKLAKENGITGDYTKMLENASLKHRISRLEAMKLQLEQKATMLMHSEKTGLEKFAKSAYENAYYNGGFEIAKGTGVGKTLFQLDDKKINTVIHKPWAADGKNFSTRVWGQHRPQLVKNLHRSLTDSIMRGTGPDEAIKALSRDFDVSLSAAARLVQTEEAYFSSVAQRDVFAELGVEQYQIIATLDGHTSEICRDLDNKVYNMDEYEAGVTAPPFHPRCRTTTAPYFDDEVDATRAARDPETGQTVQVPADINYQEWKEKFVVEPETSPEPDNSTGVDSSKTRPPATVSRIVGHEEVDANTYSQARKDAAYWGKNGSQDDKKTIDDAFRAQAGLIWRDAPVPEKEAIYDYSGPFYKKMNANLAGYEYDEIFEEWGDKIGVGRLALEDRTLRMTEYLERSVLNADVWCNRGTSYSALGDFFEQFGVSRGDFAQAVQAGDAAFFDKLIGEKGRIYNFLSTSPVKGSGMGGVVKWNIYVPKGSHAAYIEPFARHGSGAHFDWDGIEEQFSYSREFEIILQRGGSYKITKFEMADDYTYIDVELHPEDGWDLYEPNI